MKFNLVQTVILSLMDLFQYYFIANKIVLKRVQVKGIDLAFIFFASIPISIISYYSPTHYVYVLNSLVLIGLCYALYRIRGIRLVYIHLISVMCILVVQFLILIILRMAFNPPITQFSTGMAAQILAVLGTFSLAKFMPIELLLNYVDAHNKTFKAIIVNIFVLLTACVIAWTLKMDSFIQNIYAISMITAVIILINTILLKSSLKNEVVEEQNRLYEQYMPIVHSLIDQVRTKQHDFDNHIMALKMMIEQESDAKKALEHMDDYIDELYGSFKERELIRLENKIVVGFLYSKIKQAEELDIKFDLNIEDSSLSTSLKDFEVLEILSILIDNAFETSIPNNHVKVVIKKEKHKSVVEVLNKHPYISTDQFQLMFTNGYSSKGQKNRGIGLFKLQQILEEKPAELVVSNCEYDENYVVFKVTLP